MRPHCLLISIRLILLKVLRSLLVNYREHVCQVKGTSHNHKAAFLSQFVSSSYQQLPPLKSFRFSRQNNAGHVFSTQDHRQCCSQIFILDYDISLPPPNCDIPVKNALLTTSGHRKRILKLLCGCGWNGVNQRCFNLGKEVKKTLLFLLETK